MRLSTYLGWLGGCFPYLPFLSPPLLPDDYLQLHPARVD